MKKSKWGRIISITSLTAIQASEALILSSTIRPGVHGLTKSLSNELGPFGITVNAVCPGYTDTERLQELALAVSKATGNSIKTVYENWKKNVPMARLARPEEIASLVAFLASEKAAYLTGVAINVDGGYVKTI
jgi:3-oxoacyl-[acyl-carrier protein] reductase